MNNFTTMAIRFTIILYSIIALASGQIFSTLAYGRRQAGAGGAGYDYRYGAMDNNNWQQQQQLGRQSNNDLGARLVNGEVWINGILVNRCFHKNQPAISVEQHGDRLWINGIPVPDYYQRGGGYGNPPPCPFGYNAGSNLKGHYIIAYTLILSAVAIACGKIF